ncbi:MAG: hypothetical protein ACRC20_13775 [Segniliparus sp.]|uniref:hypothetical protein n=1 Tax=Segniliparus sp. TaxID=2804064 RepID=UPI003F364827
MPSSRMLRERRARLKTGRSTTSTRATAFTASATTGTTAGTTALTTSTARTTAAALLSRCLLQISLALSLVCLLKIRCALSLVCLLKIRCALSLVCLLKISRSTLIPAYLLEEVGVTLSQGLLLEICIPGTNRYRGIQTPRVQAVVKAFHIGLLAFS